jgi:hypothetical protein
VLEMSNLSGSGQIITNGTVVGTGSIGTPDNVTRAVNHIGSDYSGSANFYQGNFLEILAFGNSASSTGFLDPVELYMHSRYQPLSSTPAAPVISVASGTLPGPTQVAIATAPDCTCRYTTDGSTPTLSSSPLYNGPINVYFSQTLNAISVKNGMSSSVSTAVYLLDSNQWPAPNPSDNTPLQVNVQSPSN